MAQSMMSMMMFDRYVGSPVERLGNGNSLQFGHLQGVDLGHLQFVNLSNGFLVFREGAEMDLAVQVARDNASSGGMFEHALMHVLAGSLPRTAVFEALDGGKVVDISLMESRMRFHHRNGMLKVEGAGPGAGELRKFASKWAGACMGVKNPCKELVGFHQALLMLILRLLPVALENCDMLGVLLQGEANDAG